MITTPTVSGEPGQAPLVGQLVRLTVDRELHADRFPYQARAEGSLRVYRRPGVLTLAQVGMLTT